MGGEREEEIRRRAYQIWEREGQPAGRDQDHWYRAQAEVGPVAPVAAAKPARRKPVKPPAQPAGRARKPKG